MYKVHKTDKITRVLILYYRLLSGEHIDKTIFACEHGVSKRGFDRDIESIRLFLNEMYFYEEIIFEKLSNTYYYTGGKPKRIGRIEITILLKILLNSRAFREDEISSICNNVLQAVNEKDKNTITNCLELDKKKYKSNNKRAILKLIGDLYVAINSGMDICLLYDNDKNGLKSINVSPLEIEYNRVIFILVAAKNFNLNEIIKIPIDKIDSYKILNTNYTSILKSKYSKLKEE